MSKINQESHSEKRGESYGVLHLQIAKSRPVTELLSEDLGLSAERLNELIGLGAVYVDGERQRDLESFTAVARVGSYVRIHTNPRRYYVPSAAELKNAVVADHPDFLIVNKPARIPVHALVDNAVENLKYALSRSLGVELFTTSRLDIPTCGLMVYAKNKGFLEAYNRSVRERTTSKRYRALVRGNTPDRLPPLGLWTHFMDPSIQAPKIISHEKKDRSRICELKVLRTQIFSKEVAEVEIDLITGRTHQIRAQLAYESFPILGDRLYGSRALVFVGEEIALQCFYLKTPFFEQVIERPRAWGALC